MMRAKGIFAIAMILQIVGLSACADSSALSATKTQEMPSLLSCGEEVYSREDEEGILERYFEFVSLYDFGTGESLAQDQNGEFLLTETQYLAVGYKSAFSNFMRLCIQKYNKEGNVVFDDTIITDGQGTWLLQPLATGQYIMRVIVKNMVIKSYVLNVSESDGSGTSGIPSLISCGENVYSRENEQGILEHYFEYVHLQDMDTGESLAQDRNGNYLLRTDQYLAVGYQTTFPNHMRLCIQKFDKEGTVVFDNLINTNGQGIWAIRQFAPGRYLIRVITKNMVLKSYVLKVSE